MADRNVTIELTEAATDWLVEHGYDEHYGARPLARIIQEHIKKPLADELLFGRLENGGTVKVVVEEKDGKRVLGFEVVETRPKPPGKGGSDTSGDDSPEEEESDETAALPVPVKGRGGGRPGGKPPALPPASPKASTKEPKSSSPVPKVPKLPLVP